MSLALTIEEQIEQGYLQRDWRVYFPEQFESLEADHDAALKALLLLAEQGKVAAVVELRCNEGHTVWSAEVKPRQRLSAPECQECEEAGHLAEDAFTHFKIAAQWQQKLDRKKKLPSLAPPPR